MSDMIPSVFASFDRIRIVNLAARRDRRAEMEAQLAKVGLLGDPRVEFFAALSYSEPGPFLRAGSHGAFMSHVALLREAAEANESILILQDDCDFILPDIGEYEIPANWDVFYGGYYASDPEDLHNSDIIGAHFMGFSPRAAIAAVDYFSEYLEPDFPPDSLAAAQPGFNPAIRPPIDGALVWFRRAHPQLCTIFAMLGVQRSSRTDIGDQKWFDKVPVVRDLAELGRRILRRMRPVGDRG
jgi:glycosyl transferase family 25